MGALSDDWQDAIDEIDAALIDGYQSGFPVEQWPFRAVTAELGIDEGDALDCVRRFRDGGAFRRFRPVLNPPAIGNSTLAAVSAPEERFDEVAEIINGCRQVNHNYRRTHDWNMWFVVTADSRETRDRILDEIEERTGCEMLNLPMLTGYYIDLEFPIVNGGHFARKNLGATDVSAIRISEGVAGDFSDLETHLLVEIQGGFPLMKTSYRGAANALGAAVGDVLVAVKYLLTDGYIKRIGCVVNHIVTGFRNNCMVVWSVPDDELDARGKVVGSLPYIALCYHRPRRPEQGWEYNLFTMIYNRNANAVGKKMGELTADHLPLGHERLYSTAKLKQTSAQYEKFVGSDG